jgi:hypothetical protein
VPRRGPGHTGGLAWARLTSPDGGVREGGQAGWQAAAAAPPPRAGHASALVGRYLFIVGGEAPPSGGRLPNMGGSLPNMDALWRLNLPTLQWAALHASAGGAPRVGSWAVLLPITTRAAHHDASLEDDDPISEPISDPISAPISDPISLLLVGGHGAHDGAALPIWQYTVGEHSCESAPTKGAELGGTAASAPQPSAQHGAARAAAGCAFGFGEQCDTLRGICVCTDGTPPPCDPLTGGRRAALPMFGEGALSQIGTAWLIVGVSAAGAWVGRFARVLVTPRDATARI